MDLVFDNPSELQGYWMTYSFISHWLRAAPRENNSPAFLVLLMWQIRVLVSVQDFAAVLLGCCVCCCCSGESQGHCQLPL